MMSETKNELMHGYNRMAAFELLRNEGMTLLYQLHRLVVHGSISHTSDVSVGVRAVTICPPGMYHSRDSV